MLTAEATSDTRYYGSDTLITQVTASRRGNDKSKVGPEINKVHFLSSRNSLSPGETKAWSVLMRKEEPNS